MKKHRLDWGTQIYRLFLLSMMFGVLWVKEYLWSAFILAFLLFLGDAFIIPFLQIASNLPDGSSAPRRTKTPRRTIPSPPSPTDQDESGPQPQGGEDFREPMPSRSSPRRRGT